MLYYKLMRDSASISMVQLDLPFDHTSNWEFSSFVDLHDQHSGRTNITFGEGGNERVLGNARDFFFPADLYHNLDIYENDIVGHLHSDDA